MGKFSDELMKTSGRAIGNMVFGRNAEYKYGNNVNVNKNLSINNPKSDTCDQQTTDDSESDKLMLQMELMDRETERIEKERYQEKYDSIMSIQFDEDNIKEVIKTLRSLCTYIEVEKNTKSKMYKAYMAKFNEGMALLKITEPNNPMVDFFDSKISEWEKSRKGLFKKLFGK